QLVQDRIPNKFRMDPIRDVQVLCPMNRGSLGVRELNQRLQQVLNPSRPAEPAVEKYGWRFQIREKVSQTKNNYEKEFLNGDIGSIEAIDPIEDFLLVVVLGLDDFVADLK